MILFNLLERGGKWHPKKDCLNPKKGDNDNHKRNVGNDSYVNSTILDKEIIEDDLIYSVDSPIEIEILDLGASFHLSQIRELFCNFTPGKFRKIYLVDDEHSILPEGVMGLSRPQMEASGIYKMWGLFQTIRLNFISLSKLHHVGYMIAFSDNVEGLKGYCGGFIR